VAALQDAGAPVSLANRTRARADALGVDLPGLTVLDWTARDAALGDHVFVVNTTSLGMAGNPALSLDLDRAPAGLAVADIVYVPLETPLLAAARARGLRAVEGLGLLLHQAVPGFTAWFGIEPVVDDALRRFVAADLLDA
jgi:shikimate dehydrogenase